MWKSKFVTPLLIACLLMGWSMPNIANAQSSLVGDCIALEFVTAGCNACDAMDRATHQAVDQGWVVRRIDVRHEPQLADRWRIHTTPTTLLILGGREVDRILGPVDFSELSKRMLASSSPDHLQTSLNPSNRIVRNQSPSSLSQAASHFAAVASRADSTANARLDPRLAPMHSLTRQPSPSDASTQPSQRSLQSPFPGSSNAPHPAASPFDVPQAATVRIRVDEPQHEAVGTGTIVDSFQGEALVITCGHLFRDMSPNARVTVEMFVDGRTEAFDAHVIDFQTDEVDIGLVAFQPKRAVPVVRLQSQSEPLQEGSQVFSLGCDHGQDPSRRDSNITRLNRYLGAPNVEIAGAPVQGRSGGGLFNARSELIGICYAADPDLNEGLYCGPEVVYQQLSKVGLQRLYSGNQISGPESSRISATPTAATPTATPSAAAMTVIVRDPTGTERQIHIDAPSPQLLQALATEASTVPRPLR
jgi:S1-C subfamily serine protease